MIAIPAVDLRGGRCVQLVGGRPENERVSLPDPVAVARRWWETGFCALHIVDLDAALGRGNNAATVAALSTTTPAFTQAGGGVRDDDRADSILASGADRVIVGTRALDDPQWIQALAERHPGRIIAAADTQGDYVVRKGWTERSEIAIGDFLERLAEVPLAAVLTTDVGAEGRMQGMNRGELARILRLARHPIIASGGVTTEDDLVWLEEQGFAGAVLGMALYTGTLDAERVAARWGGSASNRGAS